MRRCGRDTMRWRAAQSRTASRQRQIPAMTKPTVTATALALTLLLAVAALPVLVAAAITGSAPPSQAAITEIPPAMLAHYQQAGTRCPDITWAILAGIGHIESGHGQNRIDPNTGDTIGPPIFSYQPVGADTDHGRYDNDPGRDWAVGPMQITPATFTAYATIGERRPAGAAPDPSNAWDAVATTASYLCDLAQLLTGAGIARIIAAYNCGPNSTRSCGTDYATQVLAAADRYQHGGSATGTPATGNIGTVIATALAQLGKPYVFGTQGPDTYDCAGLITYAYRAIGTNIPAYTFTQVTYGVAIPIDNIQAGDLIFTRGGVPPEDYGHVALAIGPDYEIQAPRTGDVVRIVQINRSRVQAVRRIADHEPTQTGVTR